MIHAPARRSTRPLALLLVAAMLQAGATPSVAGGLALPIVHRSESDLLLVEVRMDGQVVCDALPAYQEDGRLLLPLGALSRELGVAIEVTPATGRGRGFVLRSSRPFELDVASARVVIAGRVSRLEPGSVELHDDDLFVDVRTLQSWLPADVEGTMQDGVLSLRSREAFPAQLRRARQLRSLAIVTADGGPAPDLPRLSAPYAFLSFPFVDQTLRSVVQRNASPSQNRNLTASETHIAGDLLFAQAHLYVANENAERRPDIRMNLGRRDPEGRLLGPLGATEVAAGEIQDPGEDLITRTRSAPGFVVGNVPLSRPDHFDRHTFAGPLRPDWDVELYRNGLLVGYAQSGTNGGYRFEDMPLDFGYNEFQLVFYGPHGERHVETHVFNVGTSMPRAGSWTYRLVASHPRDGEPRGQLETEFSPFRGLALSAAGVALADRERTLAYTRTGLRVIAGRAYTELSAASDPNGGLAARLDTRLLWGVLGLAARHLVLNDFRSEALPDSKGTLRERTTMSANLTFRLPVGSGIPLRLEASPERSRGALTTQRLTTGVRAAYRAISVSHQYHWSASSGPGGAQERSQRLDLSAHGRLLTMRSALECGEQNGTPLRSGGMSLEGNVRDRFVAGLGLTRDDAAGETRYRAFAGTSRGGIGLSFDAEHGPHTGTTFRTSLNFGLARDPRGGRWSSRAQPVAGTGGASALVFVDRNGNGLADPGDPPIPDASLVMNGAGATVRTGADGTAFLLGLPSDQSVDVALAPGSLEDPTWSPLRPAVRFVPRAGRTQRLEFPVVIAGEIVGTTSYRVGGTMRAAAGIPLELVSDPSGMVIQRTRSAFDGFFDITRVPPGRYTLRLAKAAASKYSLPPRHIVVDASGTLVDDVALVLEPAGNAATLR